MRLGGETPASASPASEARAGDPGPSDGDALALRHDRDRHVAQLRSRAPPSPRSLAATCFGATEGAGLGPLGGWPDVLFAALAQAAAMSGFGVVVAALAIAAERVTGSKALGTFALALEFAARACAAVPAARAAARRGRRPVLLAGAACGSIGSLLVAADVSLRSYVVGVVGVLGIGVANAVAQQARFVAAEAVKEADKKRALAVCVAGGAVAAFAGPELAKVSRTWLDQEYGGCFVAMAMCYFAFGALAACARSAGTVVVFVNAPGALGTGDSASDVFRTLSSSTNARKGTACVASAWPLMFLVMSAAPLAMTGAEEGGLGFDRAADAIQLHLLAMFAPGALGTGDLVKRIGPDLVAHIGCALFVACAVFANAFVPRRDVSSERDGDVRIPYWAFRDGLVVLGVAWHLVFLAGSAMLSDEGSVIQGACESLAFALVAACAAFSGAVLQRIGWRALNAFAAAGAATSAYLLRERFLAVKAAAKKEKDERDEEKNAETSPSPSPSPSLPPEAPRDEYFRR